MLKTFKLFVLLGILTMLVWIAAAEFGTLRALTSPDTMKVQYEVKPGDNLWNIVSERCEEGDDVRMYIFLTRLENKIRGRGDLHTGDELIIVVPRH